MVGSSKKTKTKNMAGSSKKTKIMKMAGSSKQGTNLVAEPDTDAKFNRFLDKNKEISWVDHSIELFSWMLNAGFLPNETTIMILLSTCVGNGNLGFRKRIHSQVLLKGMSLNCHLGTALVDMYIKSAATSSQQIAFLVVVGYFCPAYDFSNDVEKLMDGLAKEWKGIKFAKVSTASNRALVELAPVGTFPTFVYMKDGCEQDRLPIVDTVPLFSAKYPIPIAVPAMHAKLAVEKWLKEVTDGE